MSREDRAARAALALACGMFAVALPWPERDAPPCAAPREAAARDGHTTAVRCDGRGPHVRGPARLLFRLGLDPNRADARALEALPGIGPARAAAIVAERKRRPFRGPGDLRRVPGIGPVTLRRIEPWLAIAGETSGEGGASLPQNR